MKSTYKAYTIVTGAIKRDDAGWTARLTVYDVNGDWAMGLLELGRDVTFATPELADQAALLLGRAWVDIAGKPESSPGE